MARRLTIQEAEQRHPDLVKGQRWRKVEAEYRYNCNKHGVYLQQFHAHNNGQGCPKCYFERLCTTNGLSRDPEYCTVVSHFYYIFTLKSSVYRNYKGMPFFDGWNPKKGGSYLAGAEWIIKNLGRRPKGASMHIVDHEKGFVPNNLEWAYPIKQSAQKMFKIIANLKHRIKELELRLEQKELA
jgi:hypothetical protein